LRFYPLSPEADSARLPVAVLSGFLGSGKTTLLNRLLQDPAMAGTAVAINEFGSIPLDQHLIDHGADKTVVLANGCLCCSVGGDMEDAVMRIFSRRQAGALPAFARLVVEPSGLADPAPIAQAILRQPTLARVMRLETIVTVVDGVFGLRQLAEHPEARKQAAIADLRVVSKGDLADTACVVQRLHDISDAPVLDTTATASALFPPGFLDPAAAGFAVPKRGMARAEAVEHSHSPDVESVSLGADAPLDWGAFELWLREVRIRHADDLLRVKGILNIAGRGRPVVIQGVHHVLHPPTELAAWPDDDRRSRLVLIVRGGDSAGSIRGRWAAGLTQIETGVPA
jgi:G3E family GTPase